jgi:IS30 family transposase
MHASPSGLQEGDLMIFERAQGKTNVASLVERKTRFAVLFRNNDRSTTHLMNKLMGVMEPLPHPARKSITFDSGIEFRNWRKLKPGIGTEAWFCDPQAPWQKGSIENLDPAIRQPHIRPRARPGVTRLRPRSETVLVFQTVGDCMKSAASAVAPDWSGGSDPL